MTRRTGNGFLRLPHARRLQQQIESAIAEDRLTTRRAQPPPQPAPQPEPEVRAPLYLVRPGTHLTAVEPGTLYGEEAPEDLASEEPYVYSWHDDP